MLVMMTITLLMQDRVQLERWAEKENLQRIYAAVRTIHDRHVLHGDKLPEEKLGQRCAPLSLKSAPSNGPLCNCEGPLGIFS